MIYVIRNINYDIDKNARFANISRTQSATSELKKS